MKKSQLWLGLAVFTAACSHSHALPIAPTVIAPVQDVAIMAGDYTLTLVADPSCTALPNDLRTRSYAATIMPSPTKPAGNCDVLVRGLFPFFDRFQIVVRGHDLILDDGGYPTLFEQIPPYTYLEIDLSGGTLVEGPLVAALSFPFNGTFEYCVLRSSIGLKFCDSAADASVIMHSRCDARNNRLILAGR